MYSSLAINLCRRALGGQTVKNLRRLTYEFELDQSQRKSSQVGDQTKRKLNESRTHALTCVDLRVRLARALQRHTWVKGYAVNSVRSFSGTLSKGVRRVSMITDQLRHLCSFI